MFQCCCHRTTLAASVQFATASAQKMATGNKVPSAASLCHHQHTVPTSQEATTTQDTLLPGLKIHFLVLSTLIHHKRKKPRGQFLPGCSCLVSAQADSCSQPRHQSQHSPKDRGHLTMQEQGKGFALHTFLAASHPVELQRTRTKPEKPLEGQLCPHLTCALPSARRKPLLWRWIPLDTPLVEVFPFCTSEG